MCDTEHMTTTKEQMMMNGPKYPAVEVQLTGTDGNVFALMGQCTRAARRAGLSKDVIDAFVKDVTSSGSYDEALGVMMTYFEVS